MIFAKDQKNFYALSKGNQEVQEGLSLYEADTLFRKRKDDEKLEIKSFFLSSC